MADSDRRATPAPLMDWAEVARRQERTDELIRQMWHTQGRLEQAVRTYLRKVEADD